MDRNIGRGEGKSKKLNMILNYDYKSEPWAQQMDELLGILGVEDLTVRGRPITERTTFEDFYFNQKEWDELTEKIDELYYINVDIGDFLWEVSEKIHDRETLKKKLG